MVGCLDGGRKHTELTACRVICAKSLFAAETDLLTSIMLFFHQTRKKQSIRTDFATRRSYVVPSLFW